MLANQLRGILNEPVEGFAVELADEANLFEWRVWIEGPKDTCYEGGVFQLSLTFPKDYPMSPPELKFVSDFWHPNVFSTGKVLSILHPPGEDAMSGELPEERWLPTQSVTTIILSLLSVLNDPNCASPANVDASVEWRNHRDTFKNRCLKLVEKANRDLPAHVVIPHPESDADQHRRRIQKFHEMNKDLDAEDFYDNDAEEAGDGENNESGDEDEFTESENEDINTDDEQSPKVPKERTRKASSSNDAANKEADVVQVEVQVVEVKQEKDVKGKEKVEDSKNSSDEEIVATETTLPPSSSSSSAPSPQPSQPSQIAPLPNNSNNNSSDVNNNSNNNSNNNLAATAPHGKKGKRGKKAKKCAIM